MRGNTAKQKEKPNQRKLAFRQEATLALLQLRDESEVTFEKAMEVAKLDCKQCKLHDVAHNPKHQNCRDNPFCIHRLGLEKFEKLIYQEIQNRDNARKDQKRRDLNDQPAGLVNTGNFCYVNSCTQVLYNIPEFRQIIYDFRPSPSYIVPEHPKMDIEKTMMALLDLFYTLETTPFLETDKNNEFFKALRLNEEQQDQQEFTLKLLDALDRNLKMHPNGESTRERIRNLYMGMTCSRIVCECGMFSKREEICNSIQLNIDGHATLLDALDAYFAGEKLDDYICSKCSRKGHCVKESDFVQLPPVIIIQLNRYKYTTKGRQKLKTNLAYPREIAANAFQRRDKSYKPPAEMYDLFAVTIHDGNNAECGHYYDFIKSPFNQKWYRYNDANVEPLPKPPGTDKATNGNSKRKDKEKSSIDQKACYGLFYRRKDEQLPLAHPKFPPDELVAHSRSSLEALFEGQTKSKIEKSEKRLYDLQRRVEKLKNTQLKLETHEAKYTHANEIVFLPTTLLANIFHQEYEVAKGEKKRKESENEADVSMESNGDGSMLKETSSDVDLLAFAMSSSELPVESRIKTRAQNGITKSVFGYQRTARKSGMKPPISTRVAQELDSHEIPICGHGKMAIETILFGDVKAVCRAPAIALLREYEFRSKIMFDDGRKEYPLPEKDREVFVFTAEDICMECVFEMRREGIFNERLEEDDRLARKIYKEDKMRCSVKSTVPKPDDWFYVAKCALGNFKKMAIGERQHRMNQTLTKGGTLILESSTNQKRDGEFPEPLKRIRGGKSKRLFVPGVIENTPSVPPEKIQKMEIFHETNGRDYCATELPENLLDGEEEVMAENGTDEMRSSRSTTELEDTTRPSSRSTSTAAMPVEFNNELRCPHGGINYNQFRSAVSPEEWARLCYYFAENFKVSCSEPVCAHCQQLEVDAQNGSENMKQMVKEMRRRLADVIRRIELREESGNSKKENIKFGVCSVFMEKMKKLSNRTVTSAPPICQSCVLCQHGKPFKGFANETTLREAHIIGLTADEWSAFVSEITAVESAAGTPVDISSPSTSTDYPLTIRITDGETIEDLCLPCSEQYCRTKEEQKYQFDNEHIHVRLVNPADDDDTGSGMVTTGGGSKTTRRRKNLISLKLSSSSKLLDLKIALYEKCYQLPKDQLLYRTVGGEVFDAEDDQKTLFELRLLPNNTENPLVLISFQNNGRPASSIEETSDHRIPERGFVDTALAH